MLSMYSAEASYTEHNWAQRNGLKAGNMKNLARKLILISFPWAPLDHFIPSPRVSLRSIVMNIKEASTEDRVENETPSQSGMKLKKRL